LELNYGSRRQLENGDCVISGVVLVRHDRSYGMVGVITLVLPLLLWMLMVPALSHIPRNAIHALWENAFYRVVASAVVFCAATSVSSFLTDSFHGQYDADTFTAVAPKMIGLMFAWVLIGMRAGTPTPIFSRLRFRFHQCDWSGGKHEERNVSLMDEPIEKQIEQAQPKGPFKMRWLRNLGAKGMISAGVCCLYLFIAGHIARLHPSRRSRESAADNHHRGKERTAEPADRISRNSIRKQHRRIQGYGTQGSVAAPAHHNRPSIRSKKCMEERRKKLSSPRLPITSSRSKCRSRRKRQNNRSRAVKRKRKP
jgi:hypothetical protein